MCDHVHISHKPNSRLSAAQLFIVTVCSLVKQALMRGVGGEQLGVVYVLLKRQISSVHSVTVRTVSTLARRRAGNNPHMSSSVVFVEQKWGVGVRRGH